MSEPVNLFRRKYRELNAKEKESIDTIKHYADSLYDKTYMSMDVNSTEFINFQSRLEEAVMWATKGITK